MSCSEIEDPTVVRLEPSVNGGDIEVGVAFTDDTGSHSCDAGDCCQAVLLSFKSRSEPGYIDTFTLKVKDDGSSQAFTVVTAGMDSSGPYSGVWAKDSAATPPVSEKVVNIPPDDGDVISVVIEIYAAGSSPTISRTQTVIIKRRPAAG